MIVDANLLLYATNTAAPRHADAKAWLDERLAGSMRVGLPWSSLGAFLRIATSPRALRAPLTPEAAWAIVAGDWLASPAAWIPKAGPGYADLLGGLVLEHDVRGNLLPDAMLAALALEHGLTIYSADTDFARFSEVRWINPLA